MSDRAVQAVLPFGGAAADDEADAPEISAFSLDAEREEPLAQSASDRPEPVASELIEPGRTLALTDFVPPEVTAAERLIRLAYRLGVPGHSLAAPFRKEPAPRLLATVENPLRGDPVGDCLDLAKLA